MRMSRLAGAPTAQKNDRLRTISMKIPRITLDIIDDTVKKGYFSNRTEAIKTFAIMGLVAFKKHIEEAGSETECELQQVG